MVCNIAESDEYPSVRVYAQKMGRVRHTSRAQDTDLPGSMQAKEWNKTVKRLQGQTIPYILADIATPPTGRLNLFNLYVALSQSSGRSIIRLLRTFDEKLFQASHTPELQVVENDRSEALNKQTKEW